MSELEKCDRHPTDDSGFKSSVLKALIGKQVLGNLRLGVNKHAGDPPTEFIGALGVDVEYSLLVNECANSIADGTCARYVVRAIARGVVVEGRHE